MIEGTRVHLSVAMNYPHLSRAPISEAVLDVSVMPAADWREDVFASFRTAAQAEFPDAQPIRQVQTAFAVNEAGPSVQSSTLENLGCICWNRDKTRAIQARVNGFSVNHVKSYENWEALLAHAKQWWGHYQRLVAPTRVARCGVRFINQFEITPGEDLSVTLQTRPDLSPGLPQELEEYFQRLVIPFPDGVRAAITQVIPPRDVQTKKPLFVLDIDVSVGVDLDASSVAMWPTFDRLRSIKNQCFFESLQRTKWEDFK